MSIVATTAVKVFFSSRSAARASGKQVKDAGVNAPQGQRWYVDSVAQVLDVPKKPVLTKAEKEQKQVLQEIFDAGAKHLLTQNKQSIKEGGSMCAYRGGNNLMCAAGPFIANVHYTPKLEGNVVTDEVVKTALSKSGFPVKNEDAIKLLRSLQAVHDKCENTANWPNRLSGVASVYDLSAAVIAKFKQA